MMAPHWLLQVILALLLATPSVHAASGPDPDDDDIVLPGEEEDLDDELEDKLEELEERQEELEDELEEALEERLEAAEDLEDELEDRLEDLLEAQEELEDELEDALEEQLERQRERAEEASEDETDGLHGVLQIEEQIDALESFVVADEYIVLVSSDELEQMRADGIQVLAAEALDALGSVLVTLSNAADADRYQADANHLYHPDAVPARDGQVALLAPQALQAAPAAEPHIGMMDSLIRTQHPCLQPLTLEQKSFYSPGFTAEYGHGTAMVSAIAGHCGVLPRARISNAAVFARSERGLVAASAGEMIIGLNWLAMQGVDIINLSLSGPANRTLHRALQQLAQRNIWLVASVGNDGAAAFPRYPAAYPEVLAITAVDARQRIYRRAVRGDHLDFALPGVGVSLADAEGGMKITDGTSVAAALATGLLTAARTQQLSQDALRQRALDLGAPGKDTVFGYGLLRLDEKNPPLTE